jgi:hypothetical protein
MTVRDRITLKRNSFDPEHDRVWAFSLTRRRECWIPIAVIEEHGRFCIDQSWLHEQGYTVIELLHTGMAPYLLLIESKELEHDHSTPQTLANLGDEP